MLYSSPHVFFAFVAVQSSGSRDGFSFKDDDAAASRPNKFQDIESHHHHPFGNMLPDEDDLLTGMMDDLDLTELPDSADDYDLFGSGGGMELDTDSRDGLSMSWGHPRLSIPFPTLPVPQFNATVAGEHPYGEHPSRTLFVRNINSNVEDFELRTLFEVTFFTLYQKTYFTDTDGSLFFFCGSNTVTLGRSTLLARIGGLS